MRNRALTSQSSDAVCAFCAFRFCGAPLRPAPPSWTFRRTIKTTAAARRPSEAVLQKKEDDAPAEGGWGVSGGWGSSAGGDNAASSSNWGSRTQAPSNNTTTTTRDRPLVRFGRFRKDEDNGRRPEPASLKGDWQTGEQMKQQPQDAGRQRDGNFRSQFTSTNDGATRPREREYAFMRPKLSEDQSSTPLIRKFVATDQPNDKDQLRTRWKHVQFKKGHEDARNQEGNSSSDHFAREREERMQSAKRGETVTWGMSQPSEWERNSNRQPQNSPDQEKENDRRRNSERRTNRFEGEQDADQDAGAAPQRQKKDKRSRNRSSRVTEADEDGIGERRMERIESRRQRKAEKKAKREALGAPTPIILPDFISIGNLATALRVRAEDFAEKLQEMGFEDFTNDHVIGAEDAGLIAQEYNFEPTSAPQQSEPEDLVAAPEPTAEEKELLLARPPVVTIMGHVDHGKTTLLDYLRQSSVAAGEHGGITQHIGAFSVNMSTGRTITFLDTPGHAAFLDMRARGANVTDIVILVVAADDSVKPQTLEAIKHAQAAEVPIIVAITKVDKDEADPERVKRDLAQHGIQVEDFGGDVQAIPVSGKTGAGMDELEEAAVTLADVLDVRADTGGQAEGWVLESSMKRVGKVATVLVKRGTMRPGDIVVAGRTWAKIRNLRNEAGQTVREALPGQPVEIDGWEESPEAGAEVIQAPNLQRAKDVAEYRQELAETEKLAEDVVAANEQRNEARQQQALAVEQAELEALKQSDPKRAAELQQALDLAKENDNDDGDASGKFIQVPLVMRADVAGSVEALSAAVLAIGNAEIRSRILRADVGAVSESDVELAATARGAIVAFGTGTVDNAMRRMAEQEGVPILDGNVIYRVTDAVRELLERRLPVRYSHKILAEADVAQVFEYSIKGRGKVPVAGCKVQNGLLERNKRFKILRGNTTIYDGTLTALKHHKKDVTEIRKGTDCGMSFEDFTAFEIGDRVQCYELIEEKRTL